MSDKVNYKPENISFKYLDCELEMQIVTLKEIIDSIGFEYSIPENVLFLTGMKGIVDVIATPNNEYHPGLDANICIVDSSSPDFKPFISCDNENKSGLIVDMDRVERIIMNSNSDHANFHFDADIPENWLQEQEKIWIKRFTLDRKLAFDLLEGRITLEEYYNKSTEA